MLVDLVAGSQDEMGLGCKGREGIDDSWKGDKARTSGASAEKCDAKQMLNGLQKRGALGL